MSVSAGRNESVVRAQFDKASAVTMTVNGDEPAVGFKCCSLQHVQHARECCRSLLAADGHEVPNLFVFVHDTSGASSEPQRRVRLAGR